MPALSIRIFPDSVLRQHAKPVRFFDAKLSTIVHAMEKTMRSQPHGIGIAAPQVGIPRQIAIVDVSPRVADAVCLVLINPIILDKQEPCPSREGCMSVPDYTGNLNRYNRIRVRWLDVEGFMHEKESAGIEAICIQHELDHLNGVLFFDRIDRLKTDMMPRTKRYSR
ncbi:MAG: peptide deformylase [Candidatus Omnitrophota bacterium]|nr:peptide deformylase [Candidatus Omnitrophota bacterium]